MEDKAPHKLPHRTVSLGLQEDIIVYEDVISKEEPDEENEKDVWWCRYVMAAVVTQVFSQMVHKRIRRGCIITGEAYVFLRIGEYPSVVEQRVHIPHLDYDESDPLCLHQTAVARMFAFVVEAASVPLPGQDWSTNTLSPWRVEVKDVLRQMPDSVKTNTGDLTYKPSRVKQFIRSPIRTRSCKPAQTPSHSDTHSRESDEGNNGSESPSAMRRDRQTRRSQRAQHGHVPAGSSRNPGQPESGRRGNRTTLELTAPSGKNGIRTASYCSHACLYAPVHGGVSDPFCANHHLHPAQVPTG